MIRLKKIVVGQISPKQGIQGHITGINREENLSVELTEQDNLLATQEILIQQIIEALREKTPEQTSTIEEIEQLLVSHFENKTVEEVER